MSGRLAKDQKLYGAIVACIWNSRVMENEVFILYIPNGSAKDLHVNIVRVIWLRSCPRISILQSYPSHRHCCSLSFSSSLHNWVLRSVNSTFPWIREQPRSFGFGS